MWHSRPPRNPPPPSWQIPSLISILIIGTLPLIQSINQLRLTWILPGRIDSNITSLFIHASSPTWGVLLINSETWQHSSWSTLLSSDLKSICRTHMCLRKVWQRHFVISYLDQQPPPHERGGFTLSLRPSIWKSFKYTNTQINTNIDTKTQIQIQYKY